jgi:hypothetical protein
LKAARRVTGRFEGGKEDDRQIRRYLAERLAG